MAIDQSMFQTQGAESTGGGWKGLVKKKDGIHEIEVSYDDIKPPTPGLRRLQFKGMSIPYEGEGTYGWSRKVKALFVVKAPGTGNDGRMFTQELGIAKKNDDGHVVSNITTRSAMGQMIGAIRRKPISEGEPINLLEFLNGEFMAMTEQTTKEGKNGGMVTYGNVKKDTWAALEEDEPELVAAAPAKANPFLSDDE